MVIGVDVRSLQLDNSGYWQFIEEAFFRIAKKDDVDSVIFFTDSLLITKESSPNVKTVVITPKPQNWISLKWWYDVKLAFALKKNNVNVFVGANGLASTTTSVPQVLVVRDLSFRTHPAFFNKASLFFYKNFTNQFSKKARSLITLSETIKTAVAGTYTISSKKITTISGAVNPLFKPIDWEGREAIKDKYAAGCEYFIFTGGFQASQNTINLLKAFSIFKKWQKTSMKLLIAGSTGADDEAEFEKLSSYKYRTEVFVINNLSENDLVKLVAASYAVVYPALFDRFPFLVLQALRSEVPVLSSNLNSLKEVAGEGALYFNPSAPEELAEHMKRIFKDEQLRSRLIEDGKQQASRFNWDNTTELLWDAIQQTVQ